VPIQALAALKSRYERIMRLIILLNFSKLKTKSIGLESVRMPHLLSLVSWCQCVHCQACRPVKLQHTSMTDEGVPEPLQAKPVQDLQRESGIK